MNMKRVLDFYTRAVADGKIDENILSEAKNISSENEMKKFMKEKLLPIAQDMGYDFTVDDLVAYEKDASKRISEEDLENITGGMNMKTGVIVGLLSVAALGAGAALNTASAMEKAEGTVNPGPVVTSTTPTGAAGSTARTAEEKNFE